MKHLLVIAIAAMLLATTGFADPNLKDPDKPVPVHDLNAKAMTMWFAGCGVAAGTTVGATDETGMEAVDIVHPIRDIHVSLLHLLGLDDKRLTCFSGGRFKQLSQFGGKVIPELIS